MSKHDPIGPTELTGEERVSALRAAFVHLRLALDDLERVFTGSSGAIGPVGFAFGEREVMKPGEYAERMRVSVRRVHAWVENGMPHFTIEGRVRIRVKEADEWLVTQPEDASLEG
jgi:hypothetical protein